MRVTRILGRSPDQVFYYILGDDGIDTHVGQYSLCPEVGEDCIFGRSIPIESDSARFIIQYFNAFNPSDLWASVSHRRT